MRAMVLLVLVLVKQKQKRQNRLADSAYDLRAECCRSPRDSDNEHRSKGETDRTRSAPSCALGALVVAPGPRGAHYAPLVAVNHPHGAKGAPHVLNCAAVPSVHWRGSTAVYRK